MSQNTSFREQDESLSHYSETTTGDLFDDKFLRRDAVWLETELRKILSEIRSYPTPIAGCDAQFNGLLEQRQALTAALSALKR